MRSVPFHQQIVDIYITSEEGRPRPKGWQMTGNNKPVCFSHAGFFAFRGRKMDVAEKEAKKLIEKFEGCQLKAYKCPAGKWTIGYGHTAGVKEGDVWTQEQADAALEKEIREFKAGILKACPTLSETPNRLAACISLAYNIGLANFAGSSVARYIRHGEYRAAADAFGMWVYAGKQRLEGLVKRRQMERTVFRRDEG